LEDGWLRISSPFPLPRHYCAALLYNRDVTGEKKKMEKEENTSG